MAKETIKRQFDKKRQNPQGLKEGDDIWLEAKERKNISFAQRRKRRSEEVCKRVAEKRIYLAVKITANSTSILCGEKRWKKEDGTEL